MNVSSFSLKVKLLTLCVCLLAVSGIVGAISYRALNSVSASYDNVVDYSDPKMKLGYEMMSTYRRVRISLRTLGLQGIPANDADAAMKDALENVAHYDKLEEQYVGYGFVNGQKELYENLHATWLSFKKTGDEIAELHKANTPEAKERLVKIFLTDCPEKAKIFTVAMDALLQFHQKHADADVAEAKASTQSAMHNMFLTILAGVALGLGVGLYIATKVARTVGGISQELSQGAEQVALASVQIAESSQNLARSSTEQASALEETSATMEELTSMVKMNAENGKQAAALAASTREIALKGEHEIKILTDSIFSISADSKKIEEITNVIDDIAFQTNLLALNAAVEAARAGEQGKGFAVVAEAVRSLAQRSSVAAKDIAELIKNSVEKIEAGSHQAKQGSAVLSEIVTAVKKVADLNSEISSASEEQNNGITQIGKALNQMDQVTQVNAAASEEAAASAEELSAQSVNLKSNVNQLEIEIFGGEVKRTISQEAFITDSKNKPSQKVVDLASRKVGAIGGKALSSKSSSHAIPFDDDSSGNRKVGTVEGF